MKDSSYLFEEEWSSEEIAVEVLCRWWTTGCNVDDVIDFVNDSIGSDLITFCNASVLDLGATITG